ncbi:MAG: C4-dicarboxylate transporter DctA [Burkholderiaceae bacterium]|nr:C4-dicarboxylate transporter DctA [Burkholderiaceae bacterium]
MTLKTVCKQLYVQVLAAIVIGFLLGHFWPEIAVTLKPLGDGFIRLIKMVVPLLVFSTVVVGIAGIKDLHKVGRTGGYALLYFELVTTLALIVGMGVSDLLQLGAGMHIDPQGIDIHNVVGYASAGKEETVSGFLLALIPSSPVEAFAKGDILQVLVFSILFGFALNRCGEKAALVADFIEQVEQVLFAIVRIIMRAAPFGVLGAIAFTTGRYGLVSMLPLGKLIVAFYLICLAFVAIGMGILAWLHGFSLLKLMHYLHEELLIVLGTSSSDAVLPNMMTKMENLGIDKHAVGLVVPTGFSFNMIGTSIYLAMAAVFIAQATDTPMGWWQHLTLLGVLMLTSKGARGVAGSGFIVLAATLAAVDVVPVAGLALVFGIDHFMSLGRALTNLIGNAVAAVIVAKWSGDLDARRMQSQLGRF